MFVRFPSLVDRLLADVDPPVLDPTTVEESHDSHDSDGDGAAAAWFRRDVQAVLRGELVDVIRLARCFGREYAAAVPNRGR